MDYHNYALKNYFKQDAVDIQMVLDQTLAMADQLQALVDDVPERLHEHRMRGDNILFEGAQGTLLDIDHGTYPYVTSSTTTAGGAASGSGFGPAYFDYVLGITKAYTTRVGGGPFPTELYDGVDLMDASGKHMADKGHEFGTTTGRPRRCGWFDAVSVRRAVQINSLTGMCVTKLDVLDGLDVIKISTGYKINGEVRSTPPIGADMYAIAEPVYEEMPGWKESTVGVQRYEDLPENARKYLERIEELVGIPADIISTGPDRKETIIKRHPFNV
jgi:adenylosuccinate synthase